MAHPLKILRSLASVSTGYTYFERDQVLTEKQLNELSDYLDDQDRLTRAELLGVGIIGGLRVRVIAGKVQVSRGVGITTDGDLMVLPTDALFDRIKPYDESAPHYAPFYSSVNGNPPTMLPLFELVREGESDVRAQPMASLPGKLTDHAVVMLMESYQKDPDLCSGTDCDNLGVKVVNTTRLLLVDHKKVSALQGSLETDSSKSLKLPELRVHRSLIRGTFDSVKDLCTPYIGVCDAIHADLLATLPLLCKFMPGLIDDLLEGDPSVDWSKRLTEIRARFPGEEPAGIQYYYDFLKDLAETWNALRELLFDTDYVLCPDVTCFPKHLLLGHLANPVQLRTGLYPSPMISGGTKLHEQARFLIWRLHTMINCFELPKPASAPVIITPSRIEAEPLEKRAIPYYYKVNQDLPIHRAWNYRLSARGAEAGNYGYRASEYGANSASTTPLLNQIGCADFFRVEGHLGQKVDAAVESLKKIIGDSNLPIAVRTALVHEDVAKIRIRPPIRFGDLHRIHYFLRKDIDIKLDRASSFSATFKDRATVALTTGGLKLDVPMGKTPVAEVNESQTNFKQAVQDSRKGLEAPSYSTYRSNTTWKADYRKALDTGGQLRQRFGPLVRNDFPTSVDTLIGNDHIHWLDWLDTLIDHKDQLEDKRLLFQNFIKEHPGVEHFGGVTPGGTLILVYDDKGLVVADFMLPYFVAEEPKEEPSLPVLPVLPHKSEDIFRGGFTLIEPINDRLDRFTSVERPWSKEIEIQTNYTNFFKETLGSLGEVLGKFSAPQQFSGINVLPDTGDPYLNSMLDEIKSKTDQIDKLRSELAKGTLAAEVSERMTGQIAKFEVDLGNVVKDATSHMVATKADAATSQPAAAAVSLIGNALVTVKDTATLTGIKTTFTTLSTGAAAPQANLVKGIMNAGGMR